MTQSFGIDVATIDDAGIEAGLDLLAQPPDWLSAIEDPDRMRADLERCIPELASGSLTLAACKFKRAHIEDGSWTTLHRLKIEDRTAAGREVDLRGALLLPGADAPPRPRPPASPRRAGTATCRTSAWTSACKPSDKALPALPLLTDPERSRTLLERSLRECAADLADLQLARCTPTVMRYREGRRCTIRYDLEYPPSASAALADQRRRQGLRRRRGSRHLRRHARPLGLTAPDEHDGDDRRATRDPPRHQRRRAEGRPRRALAQGAHQDRVRTRARRRRRGARAPVRKAGRGLAELHASKAVGGPIVTWETQLAALSHATDELVAGRAGAGRSDAAAGGEVWRRSRSTFRPGRWWRRIAASGRPRSSSTTTTSPSSTSTASARPRRASTSRCSGPRSATWPSGR